MTIMESGLYAALKAIADEQAREAAEAVLGSAEKDELVTKDFLRAEMAMLRAEMAELKAELIKRSVATLIAMTGIFAAIVKLL